MVARREPDSKCVIMYALNHTKLSNTGFNVTERFPAEVKDRRRELIPVMLDARKRGKRAILVRDKMYIDNVLYQPNDSK